MRLNKKFLRTLFQRLYFGFESSGLGFPCLNIEDHVIEEQKNEIVDKNTPLSSELLKRNM